MPFLIIIVVTLIIYVVVKLLDKAPTPSAASTLPSLCYSRMFWGGWSREVHYLYDQRDIAEKRHEIDPDKFHTDIKTETGTLGEFRVSLTSCTCKQFLNRRLPCKHMYYLADDLGYSFPDNDQSYAHIDHNDFDNWIGQNKTWEYRKYIDDEDPPRYWGGWSPPIHKLAQQQERINRKTHNNEYTTTLHYCTCIDYRKRRLPCKHIYQLASESGLPI